MRYLVLQCERRWTNNMLERYTDSIGYRLPAAFQQLDRLLRRVDIPDTWGEVALADAA